MRCDILTLGFFLGRFCFCFVVIFAILYVLIYESFLSWVLYHALDF